MTSDSHKPDSGASASQHPQESVALGGDRRRGSWHRVYRAAEGALVVEWEEYRDPAPYDHADTLTFSAEQEAALRVALQLAESEKPTTVALAEIFRTYWEIRDFAEAHGVEFTHHVDFSP